MLGRAHAFALIAVLALGFASQAARADPALTYLESLKGSSDRYKAPSELDGRYTVALYVNTADSGPWRQRMWVLHRDAIGGAGGTGLGGAGTTGKRGFGRRDGRRVL